MTNPTTAAVDRIPLTRSVHYVARGLPEVPNQYGPGVLAPSEVTLTYRAAPDSQLGRVHAYVAGRIWVDGKELPLMTGGLYGQHYDEGPEGWPAWLAEEARLHDPAALRDRIAKAARTVPLRLGPNAVAMAQRGEPIILNMNEADDLADAVLAVLPAPATDEDRDEREAQAHLDALASLIPATAEERRLALCEALGLGTGAPWDAILDRATELGLPPIGQDPVARRLGLVAAHRAAALTEAADDDGRCVYAWAQAIDTADGGRTVHLPGTHSGGHGPETAAIVVSREDVPTLRAMLADAAPGTEAGQDCAHCGKPVQLITGTLSAWWVHVPGGNTMCHPQQGAASPRATPGGEAAPANTEAEEPFEGTRRCGHDDFHDGHEWADRPGVWCPGIGYDEPRGA